MNQGEEEATRDSFGTVMDQPPSVSEANREDDETGEVIEQEVVDLSGKHPMRLSEYLAKYKVFTEENLLQFELKALEITDLKGVSKELKAWLNDYTRASAKLRKLTVVQQQAGSSEPGAGPVAYHAGRCETTRKDSLVASNHFPGRERASSSQKESESNDDEDSDDTPLLRNAPPIAIRPRDIKEAIPKIRLNELIIRPETFDGTKPPPRQWLDDYERAANANGWTEKTMVKHLQTFITRAAQDWFVTIARRKLGPEPSWQEVRGISQALSRRR